jgi:putative transposase
MRTSRSRLLTALIGSVHLYWRAHNREFLLREWGAKSLYFESMVFGLTHRNAGGNTKLSAFCLMDNHSHSLMRYTNGSKNLSHFMRVAHGRFGQSFNKRHNRTGAVINERPKTPLIGDSESEMRAHFYIEANPIRAGMTTLSKLRAFHWCSYRYYAYGVTDEVTKHLTAPDWYLLLGRTAKERQEAYRKLFETYLAHSLVPSAWHLKRFIGAAQWVEEQEKRIRREFTALREIATEAKRDRKTIAFLGS